VSQTQLLNILFHLKGVNKIIYSQVVSDSLSILIIVSNTTGKAHLKIVPICLAQNGIIDSAIFFSTH